MKNSLVSTWPTVFEIWEKNKTLSEKNELWTVHFWIFCTLIILFAFYDSVKMLEIHAYLSIWMTHMVKLLMSKHMFSLCYWHSVEVYLENEEWLFECLRKYYLVPNLDEWFDKIFADKTWKVLKPPFWCSLMDQRLRLKNLPCSVLPVGGPFRRCWAWSMKARISSPRPSKKKSFMTRSWPVRSASCTTITHSCWNSRETVLLITVCQ